MFCVMDFERTKIEAPEGLPKIDSLYFILFIGCECC